jgi:hypothetical protein
MERLTERQWLLKGYLLKEGAKGKLLSSGTCYGSCHQYYYYTEDEVDYLPEKAKEIRRKKNAEDRARRKAEKERKLKYYEDHIEMTSWQWLAYAHRVPVDDADAHHKTLRYPNDDGKWEESDSKWYYYYKKDTMEVSEEEYQRLKELYIQKFGGWETIDLEHTDYNGQIWW